MLGILLGCIGLCGDWECVGFAAGFLFGTVIGWAMELWGVWMVDEESQFFYRNLKYLSSSEIDEKLKSIRKELGALMFRGRLRCR